MNVRSNFLRGLTGSRALRGLTALAVVATLGLTAAPALADDATTPAGVPAAVPTDDTAAPTTEAPAAEEPAAQAPAAEAPAAVPPAAKPPKSTKPATKPVDKAPKVAQYTAPTIVSAAQAEADAAAAAAANTPLVDQVAAPIITALAVPCLPGTDVEFHAFEIDGDTCAENVQDWSNTGLHTDDGFDDATGFTGGSQEKDDPLTWTVGNSPNDKSDIGEFWAYSKAVDGTVVGYFALTNDSTAGGTSQYDLEYNQLDPVPGTGPKVVPNRSPGDLLFRFSSTGSDALSFDKANRYTLQSSPDWDAGDCFATNATGGWCDIPIPDNAFESALTEDGTFIEGGIDIGLFVDEPGDCTGNFGSTSVRSVTGGSFETSALKDYVDPLPVNTPSTCGTIKINKTDQLGNPLGGATFTVTPNPVPGGNGENPFTIKDNDADDKNPADGFIEISPVVPGVIYTVTETVAPAGYELASPASQTADDELLESGLFMVTFVNPRIGDDLTISGVDAEFFTRTYPWTIEKSTTTPKIYVKDGKATADYEVVVATDDGTDSGWDINGTITVSNPNDWQAVSVTGATVSYDGGGGASCTTAVAGGFPENVAASGDLNVTFDCDFTSQPSYDGTLSVDVQWDAVAANTPNDHVADSLTVNAADWVQTAVNGTVVVTDDNATPGDTGDDTSWNLNWADVYAMTDHEQTLTYSLDLPVPDLGTCASYDNVADVTGDNDAELDSDDATVEVCNPYTQIQVLKVDAETGEPLAGATFELTQGDTLLDTAVSGVDGKATFEEELLPGDYTVTETIAPDGYGLPVGDEASVDFHVDHIDDADSNFVENGVIVDAITYRDPAQGQLALIGKQHWERDGADGWEVGDGKVLFGDEIRYTIEVGASGPKLFHDVTVTDFVPGFNPADVTSTDGIDGELVAGSSACTADSDFTCTSVEDPVSGLITWTLTSPGQDEGVVKGDATGTLEFTIRFPDVPDDVEFEDLPGVEQQFSALLWNQAYLDWTEFTVQPDPVIDISRTAAVLVPEAKHLDSNEVIDEARFIFTTPVFDQCPNKLGNQPAGTKCVKVLPVVGGPDQRIAILGLALLLAGIGAVAAGRVRRRS